MSLIQNWAPHFQSRDRAQGRADQLAGRVKQITPGEGERLRASVFDQDQDQTFDVVIRDQEKDAADCSCDTSSTGIYCKHIWAALLDAQNNSNISSDDANPAQANDRPMDQITPTLPKARKRSGQRKQRQEEPAWLGRLSLLRPTSLYRDKTDLASMLTKRQISYLIHSQRSSEQKAVVIELWQRHPTHTGWSRQRPMKIDGDTAKLLDDPIDREMASALLGAKRVTLDPMLAQYETQRAHAVFNLKHGMQRQLLKRMVSTGRCAIEDDDQKATVLAWDQIDGQAPWRLWMVGKLEDEHLAIDLELRRDAQQMDVTLPQLVLPGDQGVVIYAGKVAAFDDQGAWRWVSQFRDELRFHEGSSQMLVPLADVDRFLTRLYMLPQLPLIELPDQIGQTEQLMTPAVYLELLSQTVKQNLVGRVWFDYEGTRVTPGQEGRYVLNSYEKEEQVSAPHDPQEAVEDAVEDAADPPTQEASPSQPDLPNPPAPVNLLTDSATSEQLTLIRRDTRFEAEALLCLSPLGFRSSQTEEDGQVLVLPVNNMPKAVHELTAKGWKVSADENTMHRPSTPALSISTGIDWFELHGGITYETSAGQQVISLPQILAAAKSGKHMITLDDGSQGLLPTDWLVSHGMLAAMGDIHDDHLRFKTSQAILLDSLLDHKELVSVDEPFAQAREKLATFEKIEPIQETKTFQGTLRQYQREGLGWFEFLKWLGTGGILADDMGLGKTVQVLAMLEKHIQQNPERHQQSNKPTLIVAPRSVIFNWMDEAERFASHLRVLSYTGTNRHELREHFHDYDLIVTSFGLMRRDINELTEHQFHYVVLDEAQAIKNPGSQSAKAACLIQADYRLALTGTPVENHLGDLWSIFEFLNPGLLGTSGKFGQAVRGGLQDLRNEDAAMQAAKALQPFILRRTKKQVLTELPDKTEQTIICQMEPGQREIYDQLLKHYRGTLLKQVQAKQIGGSAMMVLEALLRLRQASCHPGLIDPQYADHPSAKLDVLCDQLVELIEEGHKALVFSQFTSFLALVRKRLDAKGIKYAYLDGQTRDRQKAVHEFQDDPSCSVFLISLKAGGLGLNLTAAEYVFILDPWWNPAVEQQAIDRAHRIGQTRHVFAYRLICEDTVEHRIVDLQNKKRQLADAIVGGQTGGLQNLTRDELVQLLS